jgi:hypothetical protein
VIDVAAKRYDAMVSGLVAHSVQMLALNAKLRTNYLDEPFLVAIPNRWRNVFDSWKLK